MVDQPWVWCRGGRLGVSWVSIPVLKLNQWLGFRGGMNQMFCWIGIVGCWIGVGRLIDGGFLNQFRWLELVWIDESGGDKEIRLVVAFWVGFSCWVLHFESLWVSIIAVLINGWSLFELIWRVVKPWRLDWWWVFFLGSRISNTHLAHVLIRTPIRTIGIGNLVIEEREHHRRRNEPEHHRRNQLHPRQDLV